MMFLIASNLLNSGEIKTWLNIFFKSGLSPYHTLFFFIVLAIFLAYLLHQQEIRKLQDNIKQSLCRLLAYPWPSDLCLARNRSSISICWMNKWIWGLIKRDFAVRKIGTWLLFNGKARYLGTQLLYYAKQCSLKIHNHIAIFPE